MCTRHCLFSSINRSTIFQPKLYPLKRHAHGWSMKSVKCNPQSEPLKGVLIWFRLIYPPDMLHNQRRSGLDKRGDWHVRNGRIDGSDSASVEGCSKTLHTVRLFLLVCCDVESGANMWGWCENLYCQVWGLKCIAKLYEQLSRQIILWYYDLKNMFSSRGLQKNLIIWVNNKI